MSERGIPQNPLKILKKKLGFAVHSGNLKHTTYFRPYLNDSKI